MATAFKVSSCRGCGAPIVWAKDAAGHSIPLDPRPPVYRVTDQLPAPAAERLTEQHLNGPLVAAMVSHFATCPKAAQFSGSKPKPPATTS